MRFVLTALFALALVPTVRGDEALDSVNAKRAAKGLRPYTYDPALTVAAQACATHRATNLMFGHTGNDFTFLPLGARADATGCAAYPASYGFMACAVYDNYTYAGAASVLGRDGKTYHHLFVSNSPSGGFASDTSTRVDYTAGPAPTMTAPTTSAPQPATQYTVVHRGLGGRRSYLVPVASVGGCAPATTATVNVGVTSTSSCAGGSCNVGGRTTVRVRTR